MPTSPTEQLIRQRLAAHEVRYTRGRRTVVAALARADGPRSAAELHDALGARVPLSSLYRSLAVMAEAGILSPHFGSGVTRYELAEWLVGHHHHLVCVECGLVDDVELPGDVEATLEQLATRTAAAAGVRAVGHTLEISIHCEACS